jgi:lipid-binding SYLF domain-containing protein
MKRLGILPVLLLFSTLALWAQDTSSNSGNTAAQNASSNDNAASNTAQNNTTDSDAARDAQEQAQRDANKAAAGNDANMAAQDKENAKNADSKSAEDRDKVEARLDDAAKILNELLSAPDSGIPDKAFASAKCVAVVPSYVKGGFVFGAEHGRGVATCRTPNDGWSAPAFFVVTGGSWGAQIGVQSADVVMLIMNDRGMNELLSSKFKLGGEGAVAAGPVGRDAEASTDWKMKAEVLTYSRTRGLFAGLTLNGAAIKDDVDSTKAIYGRDPGFRETLTGRVPTPDVPAAKQFLATVRREKAEALKHP